MPSIIFIRAWVPCVRKLAVPAMGWRLRPILHGVVSHWSFLVRRQESRRWSAAGAALGRANGQWLPADDYGRRPGDAAEQVKAGGRFEHRVERPAGDAGAERP